MATRALRRIVSDEVVLERLKRANINTCQDLLSFTEFDLIQVLDLAQCVVRELLATVCKSIAPQPTTTLDLLTTKTFLPTTLTFVDQNLRGGLPCGSITEIVGPAGVGKTQFCHQMAVLACMPVEEGGFGGGVVYLDTENSFSPRRIVEIVSSRYPHFAEESNFESLLLPFTKRVHMYRIESTADLINTLQDLEEIIIENNVKLVILDSIACVVRRDFGEATTIIKRQTTLATEAGILKRIAENFNIPIVVTNQVTASFGDSNFEFEQKTGMDKKQFSTAALGYVWAHAVNTRLVLEYQRNTTTTTTEGEEQQSRSITIAKSPTSPVCSFPYYVETRGILLNEDPLLAPMVENANSNMPNFWDKCIINVADSAPGLRADHNQHYSILHTDD